jgi:hypothetical protein
MRVLKVYRECQQARKSGDKQPSVLQVRIMLSRVWGGSEQMSHLQICDFYPAGDLCTGSRAQARLLCINSRCSKPERTGWPAQEQTYLHLMSRQHSHRSSSATLAWLRLCNIAPHRASASFGSCSANEPARNSRRVFQDKRSMSQYSQLVALFFQHTASSSRVCRYFAKMSRCLRF